MSAMNVIWIQTETVLTNQTNMTLKGFYADSSTVFYVTSITIVSSFVFIVNSISISMLFK